MYIELKSPKGTGRLSDLQEITIDKMRKAGAIVYVTNQFEDFRTIIKDEFKL